jgi:excisionase family DNA binding protein
MHIHDLETHPTQYVSVGELADYWLVSRRYLYKQVRSGTLDAIQIGPRSCRIATTAALEFERRPRVLDNVAFVES